MPRSDQEIEAALALHKKIRTNGLQRAIDLMEPTEKAFARRLICHALEDMIAPKVTGHGTPDLVLRDGDASSFVEPGTLRVIDERSHGNEA